MLLHGWQIANLDQEDNVDAFWVMERKASEFSDMSDMTAFVV